MRSKIGCVRPTSNWLICYTPSVSSTSVMTNQMPKMYLKGVGQCGEARSAHSPVGLARDRGEFLPGLVPPEQCLSEPGLPPPAGQRQSSPFYNLLTKQCGPIAIRDRAIQRSPPVLKPHQVLPSETRQG